MYVNFGATGGARSARAAPAGRGSGPHLAGCEVLCLCSDMQRDMCLEGCGVRWVSESFSCHVGLVARVWSRRAYVCSASALVTNIWSVMSFESESVEH
jgi:hypothetical protein